MKTVQKITKLILQYISGLIFAWGLGMWCLWGICYLLFLRKLSAGDDGPFFLVIYLIFFLGMPLGGTLGMLFVDKLILRTAKLSLIRILAGFIMGILGSCIVYWVMPFFGIEYEGWIPTVYLLRVAPFGGFESFFLISTLFALIGYNAVGLFKYKKARPDICN